jgi:hypothetical protein
VARNSWGPFDENKTQYADFVTYVDRGGADTEDVDGGRCDINFIKSNQNKYQVIYSYEDSLSLKEIEKLSKYEIIQDSIRYEYSNGGYKFRDISNNIDIILAPELIKTTINRSETENIKQQATFKIKNHVANIQDSLNSINYLGFNKWRLITEEELTSFLIYYIGASFDNELFAEDYKRHGYCDQEYSFLTGTESLYKDPYSDFVGMRNRELSNDHRGIYNYVYLCKNRHFQMDSEEIQDRQTNQEELRKLIKQYFSYADGSETAKLLLFVKDN